MPTLRNLNPDNLKRLQTSFFFMGIFIIHVFNARLDPDGHHDGYVYAAAVASSEGLLPNRDYFTQYGPLTPVIQGLWLKATSPTLLSLRLFNALLLLFISMLVFSILKREYGNLVSLLLIATLNISTPVILPYMIAWPSVLSTLIIILVLKLLTSKNLFGKKSYFFSGMLLAFGWYTRVHVVIIFLLILVVTLLNNERRSFAKPLLGGFLGTCFTVTLLQLISGSFDEYLSQTIIFPFLHYPGASAGYKVAIANIGLLALFPFYAIVFKLLLRANVTTTKLSLVSKVLGLTLIFAIAMSLSNKMQEVPISERSYLNPWFLFLYLSLHLTFLITFATIGIFVLYIVNLFASSRKPIYALRKDANRGVVLAICLGTFSQLYPGPDQLHAWWIAPVFLASLPWFNFHFNRTAMLGVLFSISIVQIYHFVEVQQLNRFKLVAPAFSGMFGSNKELDEVVNLAAEYLPPSSAVFHCPHGIFAAASTRYLSRVPDFVDWGPQTSNREKIVGLHLSCDSAKDKPSGAEIIYENPQQKIYVWRIGN